MRPRSSVVVGRRAGQHGNLRLIKAAGPGLQTNDHYHRTADVNGRFHNRFRLLYKPNIEPRGESK